MAPAAECRLLIIGDREVLYDPRAAEVKMHVPSEPNSINAFIISELRAKGAERTHRYYPYYYQLAPEILRPVFGKNVCTGGDPSRIRGRPSARGRLTPTLRMPDRELPQVGGQGRSWREAMFEASERNSLSAFIIKEMRAKGAERTHRYYPYYYQLVAEILRLVFGKNVCTGGDPSRIRGRPGARGRLTSTLRSRIGNVPRLGARAAPGEKQCLKKRNPTR